MKAMKNLRTCLSVVIKGPVELSGLMVLTVKYTVLAATSGQPEVNSTSVAFVIAALNGLPEGRGASPKKYSMESWNPVNSPRGVTRPEALALKRPAGTADDPSAIILALAGYMDSTSRVAAIP
jgi:hypothetical protein